MTIREVEKASAADPEFDEIGRCIATGDWASGKLFLAIFVLKKLCCYGQLILRDTRLIIPTSLREQVLQLAHEGQQELNKTRLGWRLAWWRSTEKNEA